MTVTVLVNGASGKMGSLACETIEAADQLTLAARGDRDDDLATLIAEHKPDVVLDLTVAGNGFLHAKTILAAGARPVIGTSGVTAEQIKTLEALCQDAGLGGLVVPNFSIGAVLMMQFAKTASRYFDHAEIIEMHHNQKKDAPSGTAMRTADMMAEANPQLKDCPTHSVRLPGLVAHQAVLFGSQGETLTIQSDCIDRLSFMPGIALCCEKVMSLDGLLVGMEHVLDA